jgi:BirA family biotin operon repressor/biotin-[acetyl-CoA-carboxylase] ligase
MPNLRRDAARDPALETALAQAIGGRAWQGDAPPERSARPAEAGSRSGSASAPPPAATAVAPAPVYAFRRVGSTMEVAHGLAAQGAPEGTLVWAARQEQGRGRLGRSWASPEGGAYCSVILRPDRPLSQIPQLSLVAGLATAEAIRELAGVPPAIRWPNDVLLDGLKVAGILVEARDDATVVGVGINVTTDPADLPPDAISLQQAPIACSASPVDVTGELYRRFRAWYDVWRRSGFLPIREALRPLMGLFGEPIQLSTALETLRGVAADLDEQGRLLVRLDAGPVRPFEMGGVTQLRNERRIG